MNGQGEFEAMKDERKSEALAREVGGIVNRTGDGRFDLTRVGGWLAIPAESSSHLSDADRKRLASAFRRLGHGKVYAVALEALKNIEPVYEVSVSEIGFEIFNRMCAHFNYALFSENVSGLVICTTDDYLVIAGRPDFVEEALGKSKSEAIVAFEKFVVDPA